MSTYEFVINTVAGVLGGMIITFLFVYLPKRTSRKKSEKFRLNKWIKLDFALQYFLQELVFNEESRKLKSFCQYEFSTLNQDKKVAKLFSTYEVKYIEDYQKLILDLSKTGQPSDEKAKRLKQAFMKMSEQRNIAKNLVYPKEIFVEALIINNRTLASTMPNSSIKIIDKWTELRQTSETLINEIGYFRSDFNSNEADLYNRVIVLKSLNLKNGNQEPNQFHIIPHGIPLAYVKDEFYELYLFANKLSNYIGSKLTPKEYTELLNDKFD